MSEERPDSRRNDLPAYEAMLHSETKAWLRKLPSEALPKSLAKNFPRIANRVALLWSAPTDCRSYLDELIFNDRGDSRQGFPPEVCLEIMRLKSHLGNQFELKQEAVAPQPQDIWGTVDRRLALDK